MSLISRLRNTIKYPTSVIVRGASDQVGIELAKALLDQGGFVIMFDYDDEYARRQIRELEDYELFLFVDIKSISDVDEYIRRLDYIFYLNHDVVDLDNKLSSQEFLEFSKFLDHVLKLAVKFDAKYLLSTSIKAHQYLFQKNQLDANFKNSDEIQSIYTESEIQKYAESLTLEYIEKTEMDGRVVRLGEALGEGVNYSPNSSLGKLLEEAANSETFTIDGDGLDSNYYIYIQDAVYGLIKAQFSKNTIGEVFSIAYEYEISTLSIVYKLNEFIEDQREIIFSDSKITDEVSAIRLYKPAPNLMRVGWKPRVTFERALKLAYDYLTAHEEDVSVIPETVDENKISFGDKVKNFFGLKKKSEQEKSEANESDKAIKKNSELDSGALSRLMSERKNQEKQRTGSIVIANQKLLQKYKSKKKANFSARVSNNFLKSYDRFTNRFKALQYLTIRQLFGLLVLLAIFMVVYVGFFAPIIASGKDVYEMNTLVNQITSNSEENGFENQVALSNEIANLASKITNRISTYFFLEDFLELPTVVKDIYLIGNNIQIIDNSLAQVNQSLGGSIEFIQNTDPALVFVDDDVTPGLLIQKKQDHIQSIEKINQQLFEDDEALENLDNALLSINENDFKFNDSYINSQYEKLVNTYNDLNTNVQIYSKFQTSIKDFIVNSDTERNILVLITDNTNATPAGGKIIGGIYLTVLEGNLNDVEVIGAPTESISISDGGFVSSQINLLDVNTSGNANDLMYLQNGDYYLPELKNIYENEVGTDIENMVILNYSAISRFLGTTGEIQVNDLLFNESNFVTNIELFGENNTEESTQKLAQTISALVFRRIFNDLETNIENFVMDLEQSLKNKDVVYKSFSNHIPNLSEYADNSSYSSINFVRTNYIGNSNLVPSYTIDAKVNLNEDLSSRNSLSFDFNNLQGIFVVCLPSLANNFEVTNINLEDVSQISSELETCLQFPTADDNFTLSYNIPDTSGTLQNNRDYQIAFRKQPGVKSNLSLNLELDTSLSSNVESTSESDLEDAILKYNSDLINDKIFWIDLIN